MQPTTPVIKGLEILEQTVGGAENGQPQYAPLPVIISKGKSISRWTFTQEERQMIADGADILITQLAGGLVIPQNVGIISGEFDNPMEVAQFLEIV